MRWNFRPVVSLGLLWVLSQPPALALEPPVPAATTAQEAYAEAKRRYLTKDYDGALRFLRHAIARGERTPHIYNLAYVYEALGRNQLAYETFLRALGRQDISKSARIQCEEQVRLLKPLLGRAVLRLRDAPTTTVLQLGDALVTDPERDRPLAPGPYLICAAEASAPTASCWRRQLVAGVRAAWPLPERPGSRGWLALPTPIRGLALDGQPLRIPLEGRARLALDVGPHRVAVTLADGTVRSASVRVEPGATASLPAPIKPVVLPSAPAESAPPSTGPWIVTGIGGATLAGGIALLVAQALQRQGIEADREIDSDGISRGISQADYKDRIGTADALELSGWVLLGVGAAGTAAGVVWGLLGRPEPAVEGTSIHVAPWPGGVSLRLRY